jgi:DNA-binding MarR family transcriptional regulator
VIAVLDGGGSRLVDLAHGIGITRQATTALVRDLEQAGIVATTEDPRDRRATLVHLTDAGVAFCQQVLRVLERRERELASRIGAERLAELKATLRSLASPPS